MTQANITNYHQENNTDNKVNVDGGKFGLQSNSPIDLPNFNCKHNPFPVDVLPYLFSELVKEGKRCLNLPIDYTGVATIGAIALAIGKTAKIKVKKGWYEFVSFFMVLAGSAGATKSHPIDLAFRPFYDIDREAIRAFEIVNNDYEEYQGLSKKEKSGVTPVEKPKLKKSILNNFTPEILFQRLTDNDISCAVVSDELATWLDGMNNYSKSDQTTTYLSIWSNKPTSIDRVSKPVPLWLPEPILNVIGGIQFRSLPQLFPASKTNNGFLQRLLWGIPESSEKQPINDNEISDFLLSQYADWIKDYRKANPIQYDDETGKAKSKLYTWSSDAKEFFYQWQAENTRLVNDYGDTLKSEIFSKFDIHFPRLSLVLQIMDDYSSNEITLKAAQGAAKLCTYFQNTAMRVLSILECGDTETKLPENKKVFFKTLPDHFTTAEANQLGESFGFNVKAVQRFLNQDNMFKWEAQGQYSKINKNHMS